MYQPWLIVGLVLVLVAIGRENTEASSHVVRLRCPSYQRLSMKL